jgi:hypothetical protein
MDNKIIDMKINNDNYNFSICYNNHDDYIISKKMIDKHRDNNDEAYYKLDLSHLI